MTIDNNLLQPSPNNNNNRRETTSFDLNHLSFTLYSGTMQDLHLPKIISQQNKENLERTAKEFDKQ